MRSKARLDYQVYPRLPAYAETAWTPREIKDYPDFYARLEPFLARLRKMGVRHAPLTEAEPPRYTRPGHKLRFLQEHKSAICDHGHYINSGLVFLPSRNYKVNNVNAY